MKGTLPEDRYRIVIISRPFLLRTTQICISDRSCRENLNLRFTYNNFLLNPAVDKTMRKNAVELARPQVAIRRKRTACWIPTATTHTHTHSQYAILTAISLQQWLLDRASMLRYSVLPILISIVEGCLLI